MLAANGGGGQLPPGTPVPDAPPALMNLRHVIQGVNENVSPSAV
jgi:hypothetical protein